MNEGNDQIFEIYEYEHQTEDCFNDYHIIESDCLESTYFIVQGINSIEGFSYLDKEPL